MAVGKIAHLKLHTEYSLLEGVGKIDEYTSKAKLLEIDALAITDTSMFGVIEFYKKCKKNGIKPIIGLEVYLDGIFSEGEYSLTLIAKNKKGYRNLSKLSSLSYSRFNRRRNKIKYEELMNYSEDLFVLSGGIHSEVIKGLLEYKYSEVRKIIKKFKDDFKDNFYLEILSIKRLENIRKIMKELVEDLNINYIFSNDVYYPNNGDAILQKIMTSIKEGNKLETEHQDILYDDLYLKSYNQMKDSFINFDEEFYQKGIENIYKIVNKCNVDFEFDQFKFPKYDLPEGITEKEYLRKLVYEGLSKKYLNETVEINSSEKEKELKENLKNKNLSNIV